MTRYINASEVPKTNRCRFPEQLELMKKIPSGNALVITRDDLEKFDAKSLFVLRMRILKWIIRKQLPSNYRLLQRSDVLYVANDEVEAIKDK